MKRKLFNFLGMDVYIKPSVGIGFLAIAFPLFLFALVILKFSPLEAIIGAVVGALLHFVGEVLHQYGHYVAAKQVGHPMESTVLWGILGTSVYPKDEGELSGRIHIRRALGGPTLSIILAAVTFVVALLLSSMQGTLIWWLIILFGILNLGGFTLIALLPLGFTDGSTILRYWGKP